MTTMNRTALFLLGLMILGSAAAHGMRPTKKVADQSTPINLERMVPEHFGAWQVDKSMVPVLPSPAVEATINKIYSQVLARTYVDATGRRVMLTIAYGGDQSDDMQVHRPEICYAAQGFQVIHTASAQVTTRFGAIPARRVFAVHGTRSEPITYWVTVGDHVTQVGLRQKLEQLSYGLRGKVPDGMLVRISSITQDEPSAYGLHQTFVDSMLSAMDSPARIRIAGRPPGT